MQNFLQFVKPSKVKETPLRVMCLYYKADL